MCDDDGNGVIEKLRLIRDIAWQYKRHDAAFSRIEILAEQALKELGVDDRPYPNPRPEGWWRRLINWIESE